MQAMKLILFIISLFSYSVISGQSTSFTNAKNWKLYKIADENAFQYRVDTLKNFSFERLSDDTMRTFISELSELPSSGPHIWMGAYIATFEYEGITRKVEISHYGGVLYDESSKKHFQIPENKVLDWLSYIRQSFMCTHNDDDKVSY